MAAVATSPAALPAKQQRSQETLECLLAAAEALVELRGHEHVSMNDIAQKAGRAVGSLYSRIGCKNELMLCLISRYLCATENLVQGFTDDPCWQGAGLRARVDAAVGLLVDNYCEHRGIVRMINLNPMPAEVERRYRPRVSEVFGALSRFLARSPDLDQALSAQRSDFGLLMVIATARSRLVEGSDSGITKAVTSEALKSELSWALWLYLTTDREERTA